MAIPTTLKSYLDRQSARYEMLPHPHTASSMETAAAAHVPGDRLAKAVIVKDQNDYLMVVVPSDYHVHLGRLHHLLGREVGLATERELNPMFPDCETGAVPPLGAAYGIKTLVDNCLMEGAEIYFEAGDHRHLIKMSGEQFAALLADARHVDIGVHV